MVSESEATAIREAYQSSGELGAAVELRRLFPGVDDMENARRCARAVASWSPRPIATPPKVVKRRAGKSSQPG